MKLNYRRASAPLVVASLALLACAEVAASNPQKATPTQNPCPNVRVSSPDTVAEKSSISFTAEVSGGDPNVTPTFNWSVSAGAISSGQGTSSITVDTEGIGGQTATATVELGGYDRACSTSSSSSTAVTKSAPAAKFAEYVTPDLSANKEQLDKFVIELQNDPSAQGYIIAYGGRTSGPADAQKAANNATNYLIHTRGLDRARALSVVGGYRERPTVELWIAPAGAMPPTATPTVEPKDVKPAAAPPARSIPPKKKP